MDTPATPPGGPGGGASPRAGAVAGHGTVAGDGVAGPTVGEVLAAAEELWPATLAEQWDAVGLVAGRPSRQVQKILLAVDPTSAVVDEALQWGADLLITHHPLLLRPVTSVAATSFKGDVVHRLIEGGCGLLTVHTNGDSSVGGVSDVLADALGLTDVQPLQQAPAGLDEEGLGRYGELAEVSSLSDFAAKVFSILPAVAGGVRVAGDHDGIVKRVAVCGGAGDSLFEAVRSCSADVFVTADMRHHPASEAREAAANGRPYLIDVSHFGSEWLWLTPASEALDNVLTDQGHQVDIRVSNINTDPWDFVLTPGAG
ncbi:Nif3-like dinuclear metal center hexameric protein [Arthrobacter castelli]|uniref:Nif3-like dinuclear metal center hexameric protein n=1 Tax=Arthrobacter castelli TaxID=271431 RepID=UPI000404F097|nr:Nif3-like dinuclear metal center hexameric protein [Arthrobacter castelli]